jgi:hypothetical protein
MRRSTSTTWSSSCLSSSPLKTLSKKKRLPEKVARFLDDRDSAEV